MSGFEDNPFADPKEINPFADPSVAQASNEPQPTTEEYNPFAEEVKKEAEPPLLPPPPTKAELKKKEKEKKKAEKAQKPSGPKRPPSSQVEAPPAVLQPEPSYEPAPAQFPFKDSGDDEQLKRENELNERERKLRERERNLARLGSDARPVNFPPLPKKCPCKPCFYVNISEEIPPGERWKMKLIIALLGYYFVMLFINLIVSFSGVVAFGTPTQVNPAFTSTSAIVTIVLAFILIFVLPCLALFCWFFPVYYAYRKDSSLSFMWWFFIMAVQCVWWLLMALGPPGFCVGIISGAGMLSYPNGNIVGGLWIVIGFLWLVPIVPAAVLVFLVHRYYRTSGGSINKAMGEAVTGAAKNEAVRGAVKQSVKAGVSAAMERD